MAKNTPFFATVSVDMAILRELLDAAVNVHAQVLVGTAGDANSMSPQLRDAYNANLESVSARAVELANMVVDAAKPTPITSIKREKQSALDQAKMPTELSIGDVRPITDGWEQGWKYLMQCGAIFKAIENAISNDGDVTQLAGAGRYIAADAGNWFDEQAEVAAEWEKRNG
ncbi:hypothetical protein ACQUFY_04570 [Robbsia andropogonis]|uniref:hypothetical protein n=1 Tax=Robbsia andropogonis TaxID=28092 RepID=UPI003D1914FB